MHPNPRSRSRGVTPEDLIAFVVSGGLVLVIYLGMVVGKAMVEAGRQTVQAFRHYPGSPLLWGSLASTLGPWCSAVLVLGVGANQPIWVAIAGVLAGLGALALLLLLVAALTLEHRYQPAPPGPPPEVPVDEALRFPWWIGD